MKKPNFIFGKKEILLACLTLILGIAIYVNYVFTETPDELTATTVYNGNGLQYGQALYVGSNTSDVSNTSDFIAQARIDKMVSREKAVDTLQSVFNGGDLTEENKAVIAEQAVAMSKLVESENKIETLIKSAGYEDCVVYLDGTSANIVVKSDGLVASQAAQIKEILLSEVFVENDNIKIHEIK